MTPHIPTRNIERVSVHDTLSTSWKPGNDRSEKTTDLFFWKHRVYLRSFQSATPHENGPAAGGAKALTARGR